MKHEVAVWWTDNQRRKLYCNVSVQYFNPGHPKIEHRAMVITGEGVGLIGNVTRKIRGTNLYKFIVVEDTHAVLSVHKKDLCLVADPDRPHISDFPPTA
jgi:hypothetical protein